ncbi:anti-sigma factor domain-containing protein [Streptomyces sp. NPDC050504]|uniref:anti-sigma factor n=1 Tax=Streptomyces sp. NPDC050504 TaxID=3365618 RepID=UPI00379BE27A
MNPADLHTLTGAYAVHALSDEERVAFERHLADCGACAQETAELTATAARLGLAVTAVPRPALRDEVLRRITTVRQDSPQEAVLPRPGGVAAVWKRPVPRWALAACLAAAAMLGGTAVWQHQRAQSALEQVRRAEQGADRITAVLAAPDARSGSAELGGGATGTVVVSRSRDRAVFVVSGMAPLPRGKAYQLWFDDGGTMRGAGLMDAGRRDQAVLLSGAVGRASGMGVTVEPAGGSDHPTSAPVALLRFPG